MLDGVVKERQTIPVGIAKAREQADAVDRLGRSFETDALPLEVRTRVGDALHLNEDLRRAALLEQIDGRGVVADPESDALLLLHAPDLRETERVRVPLRALRVVLHRSEERRVGK